MANENAKIDQNYYKALLAVTNDSNKELKRLLVDPTTIRLLVDSLSTNVPSSSGGDGTQTVATAGTRIKLSVTSVPCDEVTIQAPDTNSGKVYVGFVTVDSTRGIALFPLGTITLKISDLSSIYIDADNNGDKVTYLYLV